jgi:peroxiredoxin
MTNARTVNSAGRIGALRRFKKAAFFLAVIFPLMNPVIFARTTYPAPHFVVQDFQGETHSLEKYRGKYVVLYFWATWCSACLAEVEDMKNAYEAFQPKGIEFVTVSLDFDRDRLEHFIEYNRIAYPVIFDGQGWYSRLARLYGISATPSYVLIDPIGNIQATGYRVGHLFDRLTKIVESPEGSPLS